MTGPLDGILVVDFSQFLAGPYASLRLLDMGARVIKVENPDGGDLCRTHYLSDVEIEDDSTIFHAINRGKESVTLDLKSDDGSRAAKKLIAQADVVIQNFRPGVINRLGLGYESLKALKPDIIYGSISGYGAEGEWANAPGQDLLAQARSGIMWLSGNADDGPIPLGIPLADIAAGANLTQGILATLFQRERTGQGAHVETSLLEALIDMQFEFLTTFSNNGGVPPQRLENGSAHGYLAAPYGVYKTLDGYLALAMTPLKDLEIAMDAAGLFSSLSGWETPFTARNEIHQAVEKHLLTQTAQYWEDKLSPSGIWCARILEWPELIASETFRALDMVSAGRIAMSSDFTALRTPLRINGMRSADTLAGPKLGANSISISTEFDL